MTKTEFLETLSEAKWYSVSGKHGTKHIVKMVKNKRTEGEIHALWLSVDDPESMSIEDYGVKDWNFANGKFETYGAGVYHFGSYEVDDERIYDEDLKINESKMFKVILENTLEYLINSEELKKVWLELKSGKELEYPVLLVSG